MEEESERKFWSFFGKLFSGGHDAPIEESIAQARADGELKADEAAMLTNVLRLGRRQVMEIIIPRTDIVCMEVNASIMDVAQLIFESGHSRIPVYRENRDNIVGIVHAKDLLQIVLDPSRRDVRVEDLMRKPYFVPETKLVTDLLQEFRAKKIHLAIALDEYGGTSGLVTFEDVLEEIVGEIEDEHDAPRPDDIQVLEGGRILISGRAPLEEVEERAGLALESEQVETIGGYLCELAGRVPSRGDTFSLEGFRVTVHEADAKQVRSVIVQPPKADS